MLRNHASTLALAAMLAAGSGGLAIAQTTTEEPAEDEAVVVEEEAPAEGEAEVVVEEAPEAEVMVEEEPEAEVVTEEAPSDGEDPAVVVEEAPADDTVIVADPAAEVEDIEGGLVPEDEVVEGEAVVVDETEVEQAEVEEVEVETPVEGQIFEQSPEEVLGSTLLDATVMSADGEAIGDVEDMVLSADGQITGVVIGVGGFLGIGEKRVAMEYDRIQVAQDELGELTFMLDATQEMLENAPAFRTLEEAAAEEAVVEPVDAEVAEPVEGEVVVEPTE